MNEGVKNTKKDRKNNSTFRLGEKNKTKGAPGDETSIRRYPLFYYQNSLLKVLYTTLKGCTVEGKTLGNKIAFTYIFILFHFIGFCIF